MPKKKVMCRSVGCDSGGGMYVLGAIGAAVYFVSAASSFWGGVLGFLKAIVWPVFLVHGLLRFIGV